MEVHRFSKPVKTRTETCGDHYCPGHVYTKVTCTCGWENETSFGGHEEAIEEHKQNILQLAMGVHFEQDR